MLFAFCRYQNGKHGLHGADVLRLVETEQGEEQDHVQMDRVAMVWMKIQTFAIGQNVEVDLYKEKNSERQSTALFNICTAEVNKCYICRNLAICWMFFLQQKLEKFIRA